MTRNHNQLAWEAVEQLVCRYLEDERRDYESRPTTDREGHIYAAWVQLDRWAAKDKEAARRGYKGWSNYETWLVALWHDNEEHHYRFWREAAGECFRLAGNDPGVLRGDCTVHESARVTLAERLSDAIAQELNAGVVGFAADLLGAALAKVDWFELADHLLTDRIDEKTEDPFAYAEACEPRDVLPSGINKFEHGLVATTPGAIEAVSRAEMLAAISRHLSGDWGEVPESDRAENDLSLREGFRILSVYRTLAGVKFWIITEADRSTTTVLLPEEY